jgi:arginase
MATLCLLYPEWQGSGKSPAVHDGALAVARQLFRDSDVLLIDSPQQEQLRRERGVIGLHSVAPRFRDAIAQLRDEAPDRILTIGGTCGVEAAPVGYLNERYAGDLAVVWLDAHGDLNTPESSPSGHFHGMILRTLLGEGPGEFVGELRRPLTPQQVFLAATRDLDPPEEEFIAAAGISVTPPAGIARHQAFVERIRARGFTRVYVHLDLDALDPNEFPATLIPTAGGPALSDVSALLRTLAASFEIAGASIVEYVDRGDEPLRRLEELSTVLFC